MTVWRLVTREIRHRKLNFALGVVSVWAATGCLVAELTLLNTHDLRTQQILAAKQAKTEAEMRQMEDDYRKIMKDMGFNVLILPEGQDLGEFHADGYASKYMPEDYVGKLAGSNIMTVRHLLPSLEQRIKWPERQGRRIILVGTRGEVPLAHRDSKTPILVAVAPGRIVVGYQLWRSLGLAVGDEVSLLGRTFKVGTCYPQRGNKDDITVWIDLAQSQEMLGKTGKINAILALKCHCAGADIDKVREQIMEILPDTQVLEFATKATARARARDRAKATAETALAAEKKHRTTLRQEKEALASWLVPTVLIGCIVWVAMLAAANVRERTGEIGILRAIGLRSTQILVAFLARAGLMGVLGAGIGYLSGLVVAAVAGEVPFEMRYAAELVNPVLFGLTLVMAPLIAVLASWVPAMTAARQDPAVVLREE